MCDNLYGPLIKFYISRLINGGEKFEMRNLKLKKTWNLSKINL